MRDGCVQFPQDVVVDMSNDHSYCSRKPKNGQPPRTVSESEEKKVDSGTVSDDLLQSDVVPVAKLEEEYLDSQSTQTTDFS